jgi:hypothetical protein
MRPKGVEKSTSGEIGNYLETIPTHYRVVFGHIHHFFAPQPYSWIGTETNHGFRARDGCGL